MNAFRSRTLSRQVRKHIPPELLPQLRTFLETVDVAYDHYEQDRQLTMRAMEISSSELNEANTQLRDYNDFLESLSYAASHDLKNQAINVNGMIDMLQRDIHGDPERLSETLNYLEKAGQQFQSTVQDVLAVSRSQTMDLDLDERVGCETLREITETECSYLIERWGCDLQWTLRGDRGRWPKELSRTALVNLVSNSIKYADPSRTARIDVRMEDTDEHLLISVRDNGRGIDLQKDRGNLFKMFSRLSSGRDQEGSGVGLFILKKMMDRAGGKIQLQSELNKGTTVTLTIPHERQLP